LKNSQRNLVNKLTLVQIMRQIVFYAFNQNFLRLIYGEGTRFRVSTHPELREV